MRKISQLLYAARQGIKNISRNRMFSLASIGTMMACLFLFGIFYFVLANVQHIIKNAESSVGITMFFDEGISEDDIKAIGDKMEDRSEVDRIRYISAEEAWEKCQKEMFQGKKELAETFGADNPLADSASYEIFLNDISSQAALVRYAEGLDGVRQVNDSQSTAMGLASFNSLAGYVSGGIIIILIAVATFLISTTVTMGISVRKEEITIMRLLGASDFFIRAPFIVEGLAIGLIGALFPLTVLYVIYNKVIAFVSVKFSVLNGVLRFLDVNDVFKSLVPVSLLIGVGIGFAGSYLTVRKHLRV